MPTERIEIQRTIPAPAHRIFEVLADPQGHVDIDASGMLMDATGEPVSAVDDAFVVHMDREALGDVLGRLRPQIGHVYGYTLDPVEGATLVTSYYDWSAIHPEWREKAIFPVIPESALRATLGILARNVIRRPAA